MFTRIALGMVVALVATDAAHADFSISKKATKNVSCSGGVCTAMAKQANLNTDELTIMLADADVTVKTGGGAITIQVLDGFTWTSTHRLTLDANKTVGFHKPVVVAGQGGLTITTNNGGSGGDYWFDAGASVTFWDTSSSVIINATAYQLVNNVRDLKRAAKINPQGAYALSKDSIATSFSASPVKAFSGSFEGLGHTISNLSIKDMHRKHPLGLFGANSGSLRNVVLANANIVGIATAGVLAGENTGQIIRASANGTVSGDPSAARIGGLVGTNYHLIDKSQSSGAVRGRSSQAGGLVGSNQGAIKNSYSTSSVAASTGTYAGGLVGDNYGSITNSHADGNVTGHDYATIGGLVGVNEENASVTLSHATGSVSQADEAGGLIGRNQGPVSLSYASGPVSAVYVSGALIGNSGGANSLVDRCFATGSVQISGGKEAGGLIGLNYGAITNAYATGSVSDEIAQGFIGGVVGRNYSTDNQQGSIGTSYSIGALGSGGLVGGLIGQDDKSGFVANSYWDTETSGVSNPAQGAGYPPNDPGITGLTDAQLKSALPSGFDPQIWGQDPNINNGYPYLLANPPP